MMRSLDSLGKYLSQTGHWSVCDEYFPKKSEAYQEQVNIEGVPKFKIIIVPDWSLVSQGRK